MEAFPDPRPVRKGSRLAIVAPSGPFDREAFDAGVAWLRTRYEVCLDPGIYTRTGYFAGDDGRRLGELVEAIENPNIDAILCARGGYGATRLLPQLDPLAVTHANKLLVGFSDVTALHALWARAGVRSIHAPMVASLGKSPPDLRERWAAAVEGKGCREWHLETVASGSAVGRLTGGNLAVLAALSGTPYAPPLDGCVLFLEDVGERPYRVDRVLTSLAQAGWFERCAGVVLGAFTEGDPGNDGVSLDDVLAERLGGLAVPVARGFPAGHIAENEPLSFGGLVELDTGLDGRAARLRCQP